jgi:heme-degrading monooxygenase HmoA
MHHLNEDAARRRSAGSKGCRLFREGKDQNKVVIHCQWKGLGRAHQFAESEETRQAMVRAGVVGTPEVHFLDEMEKHSA